MTARPPVFLRPALLGFLVMLAQPRSARAEDAVRYKFQDYREMGGRVAIKVHGAAVEKTLGTVGRLKVDGVIDSIAGATPTGTHGKRRGPSFDAHGASGSMERRLRAPI
jgi:hypothetical protein